MSSNSITDFAVDCNGKESNESIESIEGTGEILEDYSGSGRLRPWSKHKMGNQKLVELFEIARSIDDTIISESRMDALRDCASWLIFGENEQGERKLAKSNFCRVRLCPMCNWRRSMKLFSQVSDITNLILSEKKVRFIFVTLTVKNCTGEELSNTINKMNKAFTYITSNNRTFAPAKKLKLNLLGYMKAEEITYNSQTNEYHPHIHCIFELRPSYFGDGYITKKDWIQLWKLAMKLDYEPSVDVRNIKGGTAAAVAEVAKYPVKLDSILKIENQEQAAKAVIYLYRAIFGRRLVTFGGDFREYKRRLNLDDVENGDLIHVETEEKTFNAVAQVLFKYRADVGAYIC